MGVFTPTLPSIAGFVGDVPVFQEWIRWFGKDDPMDVAEMLGHPDLIGNLGYEALQLPAMHCALCSELISLGHMTSACGLSLVFCVQQKTCLDGGGSHCVT